MLISFLSERPVFAPIMILGRSGQEKFRFKFERIRENRERKFALISAVPVNQKQFFFSSADIEIDTSDFSVTSIRVIPIYINGYELMLREAFILKSKLYLDCEIQFGSLYRGLRFPTLIRVTERYRGGQIVTSATGITGFIRNETEFRYDDYRFFNVEMDVRND